MNAPNDKPAPEPVPAPKPAPQRPVSRAGAVITNVYSRWSRLPVRLRRGLLWSLVTLVVLVTIFRVTLPWIVPSVLRKVASGYGLSCQYERLELSLLGGDAGLWNLKLSPIEGGDPLITAEYSRLLLSPWSLLRGRLYLYRVESDGGQVLIDRDEQGRIALLERLLPGSAANATTKAPASSGTTSGTTPTGTSGGTSGRTSGGAVKLEAPLRIDALRVQRLVLHVRDRSVLPKVDTQIALDVRLSDIGHPSKPLGYELEVRAEPLLETVLIEGQANLQPGSLQTSTNLQLRNLKLGAAAGYLALAGVEPIGQSLSAQMTASVNLLAPTPQANEWRASVTLSDAKLSQDAQQQGAAGLDKLSFTLSWTDFSRLSFTGVSLDGPFVHATRQADGALSFAGLRLARASSHIAASQPIAAQKQASSNSTNAAASSSRPPSIDIRQITVHNARAALRDLAVTPQTELAIELSDLSLALPSGIDSGELALDLSSKGSLPGLAKAFTFAGKTNLSEGKQTLTAKLSATGIKPDCLATYLVPLGVESLLVDGSLQCDVQASLSSKPSSIATQPAFSTLAATLTNITLTDSNSELLALPQVVLEGVGLSGTTGRFRVGSISVTGPATTLRRQSDGSLSALGFAYRPAATKTLTPAPATQPLTPTATTTAPTATTSPREPDALTLALALPRLPRFELGSLLWKSASIELIDQAQKPAATVRITDVGLSVNDITIDPESPKEKLPPGRFTFHMTAPGLADSVTVEGTIQALGQSLSLSTTTVATGLSVSPLQPYLTGLPAKVLLNQGSLSAQLTLSASESDKGLSLSLSGQKLRYAQSNDTLAAAESFGADVTLASLSDIDITSVRLQGGSTTVTREADGSLTLLGMNVPLSSLATAGQEAAVSAPAVVAVAAAAPPATAPAAPEPTVGAPAAAAPAPAKNRLLLRELSVHDSSVAWNDRAVSPAVATVARADVSLSQLTLGSDVASAPPAKLDLAASIQGSLRKATITGTIKPDSDDLHANLKLAAQGLTAGSLASYLPKNLRVDLKDASAAADVTAAWTNHKQGGKQGFVTVDEVSLSEAGVAQPLLAVQQLSAKVTRFDLANGVIALDALRASGVKLDVSRNTDGSLSAPGITLLTHVPAPAKADAAPPAERDAFAPRRTYPAVSLESLDVEITHVGLSDQLGTLAVPIAVDNLKLRTTERIEVLGSRPFEGSAIRLELTTAITPLIDSLRVEAELWPFTAPISTYIQWQLQGIRGNGLLSLLPALQSTLHDDPKATGSFTGDFWAQLNLDRRDPLDFNVLRGFEVQASLGKFKYRSAANDKSKSSSNDSSNDKKNDEGPTLAGFDDLRLDTLRVEPNFAAATVAALELTKPALRVSLMPDGVHALGLIIKHPLIDALIAGPLTTTATDASNAMTQPATTQPSNAAAAKVSISTTATTAPASGGGTAASTSEVAFEIPAAPPAEAGSTAPKKALRIKRLAISGIDVTLEDQTVTPATILPLSEMELEVFDASTASLSENIPVRFSLLLNAGKVPLPRRGTAASTDDPDAFTQRRELFSQVSASGRMSLYPMPAGWAKLAISGLELAALRGQAARQGLTLGGGVFDATIDARMRGDGSGRIDTKLITTDLRVSELPDGPVKRGLDLPAPLDVAIAALQDGDGSITIPVSVAIVDNQYSRQQIAGEAALAITGVIIKAIASSPLKVGALVAGNNNNGPRKETLAPRVITFPDGSPGLESAANLIVTTLAQALRDDPTLQVIARQELSTGDVDLATTRANPDPAACLSLVQQLRARRTELARLRDDAAGKARGQIASRVDQRITQITLQRLRSIDRELSETEDALDLMGDLLRPGADRQTERRTRAAALVLARQRLDSVKSVIDANLPPDAAGRVTYANAGFTVAPAGSPAKVTFTITRIGKPPGFDPLDAFTTLGGLLKDSPQPQQQ